LLQAERYLNASNGDLTLAASLYFDEHQEQDQDQASEPDVDMAGDDQPTEPASNPPQQPAPGGGRTLDGTYVPPPAGAASSSSSQPASSSRTAPQRGLRTLKDLQSGGGGGQGHAHGDDHSDDDDEQDDENQDFFTGGEKSGLAVQNPNAANPRDQINNILKRARQ
jgi:UBX domain-containing protein 1